jgi:ribulose-phosphate 3-epimerase
MKPIYPSLIAADLLNIGTTIETFNRICDGFHVDIMDNHFVPNLTWGTAFANAIARASRQPTWVHLMVDNPEEWLDALELTPGSTLTFHFENSSEKNQLIRRIKEKNLRASIAINPKTPVEEILPIAHLVDQIVIMSVEPGFSGQEFIENSIAKIEPLIQLRVKQKLDFTIAMDGGINATNIHQLSQKGVDEFAAAKAIFGASDPVAAYEKLKKLT